MKLTSLKLRKFLHYLNGVSAATTTKEPKMQEIII